MLQLLSLLLLFGGSMQNTEEIILEAPQPGPQVAAFRSAASELLYGGGVFGGKTWWLTVDAMGIQFERSPLGKKAIDVPEYRAVIFRRKTTQLTKLIDESRRHYPYFGGVPVYRRPGEPGFSWTFPSGAKIFFCHLESEDNKFDHDSMEYQYIGYDQLEQFTLTQYLHLMGRGRTTIPGLWVRYRSTANWIGSGLKWVRARFPRALSPGEMRYFISDKRSDDPYKNPAGLDVTQQILDGTADEMTRRDAVTRMFIPALYTDNKIGLERDPGYAGRVKMQGNKHERALLNGDPEAFSGDYFPLNTAPAASGGMCVPPFEIPTSWRLILSIDPGWTSPMSAGLKAIDLKGNHYRIMTYYKAGASMQQNVDAIVTMVKECRWTLGRQPSLIVSGHDAWAKHTRLAIIGEELTYDDMFQAKGWVLQRAVTDRVNGWGALCNLMMEGKWFYFDGLNEPLIEEMQGAEHDDKDPNDIKGGGNDASVPDHALDDERYNVMSTFKPSQQQPKPTGWVETKIKRKQPSRNDGPWEVGMQ